MKPEHSIKQVSNRGIILTVCVISSLVNPFMGAAMNIALPQISAEFSMNAVWISWVSMAFLLSVAVFLVPIGKIADTIGLKRMFVIGNIVVAISSIICAFSVNGGMLIAFRVFQGIGSAMIFGTAMAIVTSVYPPKERGRVIGMNVTAVYVGLSISPLIGGIMTQYLGWRSLLFLVVPIALFNAIVSYAYIKEEWIGIREKSFDFIGSIMYILFMSCFIFGFSKLPDPLDVILTIIGAIGLTVFIWQQQKISYPLINMQLFRNNKSFAFSNLSALINYASTFAISFVLSLYLQYAKGLTPRDAGLILITQPVVMAIFASISGRLSDKYDAHLLSSIGMGIIVIGLLFLSFLSGSTTNTYLIASLIILGMGFGIFSSPNTNAIMSSVDHKHLGMASAMVSTMRVTGQMLSMGIAALVVHLFLGNARIGVANITDFIGSARIIFIICSILCVIGVFASLTGIKSKLAENDIRLHS